MESSAKHFFHMSKKNHRRKGSSDFNHELNNRMSPILEDEMQIIGQDLGLRKFTYKCRMEQVD